MEQKVKNKIYISVISVLILALIGFAYAYFVDSIIGNDNSSKNIVKSGNIELTLDSVSIMSKENFIPGDMISTTFSVKNTGTNTTTYTVYFSNLVNTFINDDILYTVTCSASSGSCDSTGQLALGTNYQQAIVQNSIGIGVTHNYNLTITYLERSSAQDYNKGNSFGFTIKVNETSAEMLGILKEASSSNFYQFSYQIINIDFENGIDIPSDAVSSWDVSDGNSGTVMAYISPTETSITTSEMSCFEGGWWSDCPSDIEWYDLHIQFNHKVYAPANSSGLFGNFINVRTINNFKYLDTSNTTDMSGMFAYCTSLTSADFTKFNTSNVTNMAYMFSNTYLLTSLDLSSFNTSNVTNVSGMFTSSGITYINFANAIFTSVETYNNMFIYPTGLNATVDVNDSTAQAFINARLSDASSQQIIN